MTNFEYIKTMDEDALINFLMSINFDDCSCPARSVCHKYNSCKDAFKGWLKDEHLKV